MLFPLYLPSSAFRFLAYSPSTPTCLRFQFFPISPRSIFLLLCLLQHCLLQQYKCRKMAVCMWPIRTIIRAIRLQTVWCCKPLNWLYNYCQDIFQAKIVKMAGAINFVDIEYNRKKERKKKNNSHTGKNVPLKRRDIPPPPTATAPATTTPKGKKKIHAVFTIYLRSHAKLFCSTHSINIYTFFEWNILIFVVCVHHNKCQRHFLLSHSACRFLW